MHDKVEAEGRCRMCGKKNRVWTTPAGKRRNLLNAHHIVERSEGGDDVAENCLPLCGSGTQGCHGDVTAWRGASRHLMRAVMLPEEIAYVLERKGRGWLDRHYPDRFSPPSRRQLRTIDRR